MRKLLGIGDVIALNGERVTFETKARSHGGYAPEGEYVVLATALEGGGTGHGPHDVYPDGHNVYCQKLNSDGSFDSDGLKISFYQSGCFAFMIEDIAPVRKMKMIFV